MPFMPRYKRQRSRESPESQGSGQASADKTKRITASDFSGENVASAVLQETLVHPATIYPLAGSAVSLAWSLIINPSPESVIASLALAFVGASAFVYNYVIKGEERAVAHVTKLRTLRREQSIADLDELGTDCLNLRFMDGYEAVKKLNKAYEDLLRYLQSQKEEASSSASSPAVDRFIVLAEDTFKQGMRTIEHALDLFKALDSVNRKSIDAELKRWQKEYEALDPESSKAKTLKQSIDGHKARIAQHERKQEQLSELLAEATQIELALQSTYLELVEMGSKDPSTLLADDGGAAQRLKDSVEAAKRIEARLRSSSSAEADRRAKYTDK